jgi:hypothetical protein
MQQMDQIKKKKTDYYKMEKIFFSKIENNVALFLTL